jgi:hypothetical protein
MEPLFKGMLKRHGANYGMRSTLLQLNNLATPPGSSRTGSMKMMKKYRLC